MIDFQLHDVTYGQSKPFCGGLKDKDPHDSGVPVLSGVWYSAKWNSPTRFKEKQVVDNHFNLLVKVNVRYFSLKMKKDISTYPSPNFFFFFDKSNHQTSKGKIEKGKKAETLHIMSWLLITRGFYLSFKHICNNNKSSEWREAHPRCRPHYDYLQE